MQHFIDWLVLCTYFILFWSVTCIAFKFCCILLHAVLTTNKDHTPSQFQTTDWFRSKAVPNHLKSRQDALFLRAFQEPNTYYLIRIWYRSRKKLTYPELRSTKTSTVEAKRNVSYSSPWFITTLCISDETRRIYWSNFARFIDPDSSRLPPNRKNRRASPSRTVSAIKAT